MPRFNKDPNPYAATAGTNYSGGATTGGTTGRVVNLTGMDRPSGFQVTNGSSAGQAYCYLAYRVVSALPGQTWSGTPQIRVSASATVQYYVAWLNTSGAQIGTSTGVSFAASANTPVRLVDVGVTAPANTTHACGVVIVPSLAASATLLVTAHRIEQVNDPNLTYVDGDTYGGVWDSTVGASTSTVVAESGAPWWALTDAV